MLSVEGLVQPPCYVILSTALVKLLLLVTFHNFLFQIIPCKSLVAAFLPRILFATYFHYRSTFRYYYSLIFKCDRMIYWDGVILSLLPHTCIWLCYIWISTPLFASLLMFFSRLYLVFFYFHRELSHHIQKAVVRLINHMILVLPCAFS